jgi:hypothetical protein
VIEAENAIYVIKIYDGTFYTSRLDYLRGLLVHNYFFPHLAYGLLRFSRINQILNAMVRQPYVETD